MNSFGLKELTEHYFATESEVTDYVAASDYEKLKAYYDSILAELQKANGIIIDLQHNPPKLAKEFLAEIKAEAGRAGFVAGAEMWCDCGVESQYKADCLIGIEADADRYFAKIRNTGTWFKDSNVNGGKRQGGE